MLTGNINCISQNGEGGALPNLTLSDLCIMSTHKDDPRQFFLSIWPASTFGLWRTSYKQPVTNS